MKRLGAVIAVTSAVLVAAGCSSSGGTKSSSAAPSGSSSAAASASASSSGLSGAITVDGAASLTGAFTTLKASFVKAHPGTSVTLKFGASSDLATQIVQGDVVDVFASASPTNMAAVVKAGLASSPTNFVSNTAEIATPPKNPAKITAVKDLSKSGVKVAAVRTEGAVRCRGQ